MNVPRPPRQRSVGLLLAILVLGLHLGSAPLHAQRNRDTITIDNKPCGPHGTAKEGRKEYAQNALKNRWKFPSSVVEIDINDLISGNTDGLDSSSAVELVGYVESVKASGAETCNCGSGKRIFADTHIELTPGPDHTGPRYRVSVEVTPRFRQIMDQEYGEDWGSATLKRRLEHRWVRIQGWMFYDGSHDDEDFVNDPEDNIGRGNRRATCWEVHPVTFIEVMDEEYVDLDNDNDYDGEGTSGPVVAPHQPTRIHPPNTPTMNTAEHTPAEWLQIILLAMILGIVGQLIRAVVGISKESAKVASGDANAGFRTAELLFSLLISMAVGAVAGVLAAVSAGEWKGGEMISAFIAAGYAGTDFIEGWMKKAGTGGGANVARNTPGAPAAGTIPPDAPARVVVP